KDLSAAVQALPAPLGPLPRELAPPRSIRRQGLATLRPPRANAPGTPRVIRQRLHGTSPRERSRGPPKCRPTRTEVPAAAQGGRLCAVAPCPRCWALWPALSPLAGWLPESRW